MTPGALDQVLREIEEGLDGSGYHVQMWVAGQVQPLTGAIWTPGHSVVRLDMVPGHGSAMEGPIYVSIAAITMLRAAE